MKMYALPLAVIAAFLLLAFSQINIPNGEKKVLRKEGFAIFDMDTLLTKLEHSGRPYLPFLNKETLRCGIYELKAGAEDKQEPHALDEVYYVLSGKGRFTAGEADTEVKKGDVLFVAAKLEHRFYDIEEDLQLLVFFSTKDVAED